MHMHREEPNPVSGLPASPISEQMLSIDLQTDRDSLGTFSRTIMVEATGHPGKRAMDWGISLAANILLLGLINMIPLFLLPRLHAYTFASALSISAVPPPSATPGAELVTHRAVVIHSLFVRPLAGPLLQHRPAPRANMEAPEPMDFTTNHVNGATGDPLRLLLPDPRVVVIPNSVLHTAFTRIGGAFAPSRWLSTCKWAIRSPRTTYVLSGKW